MQLWFSCPWLSYTAPHDDLSTSRASPNSLHLTTFGVTQLVMVLCETLKSVLLAYPSLLWRKGIKETNLCHIFSSSFWSRPFLGSITSRCSGNEPALLPRKVSSRVWPERAAEIAAIWFCNPVLIKESPLLLAKSAKIAWKRHQGHKI